MVTAVYILYIKHNYCHIGNGIIEVIADNIFVRFYSHDIYSFHSPQGLDSPVRDHTCNKSVLTPTYCSLEYCKEIL